MIKKYVSTDDSDTKSILDLLKQHLAAMSKRLKRYRTNNERRLHNILFTTNEAKFYKGIIESASNSSEGNNGGEQHKNNENHPSSEDIKRYWEDIWSKPVTHISVRNGWPRKKKKSLIYEECKTGK